MLLSLGVVQESEYAVCWLSSRSFMTASSTQELTHTVTKVP